MTWKNAALVFIFIWFAAGGIGHFVATDFFLQIVPPGLPYRRAAVLVSGFFELAGAAGLLFYQSRQLAGIGLILLTIAVTPANIYMWTHADRFPHIPEPVLAARLIVQVLLIGLIWWSTRSDSATRKPDAPPRRGRY